MIEVEFWTQTIGKEHVNLIDTRIGGTNLSLIFIKGLNRMNHDIFDK